MCADDECWLPVPGYAGWYEVSCRGGVYSLPRAATAGGLLAPKLNSRGYRVVSLSRYGMVTAVTAGRLVLLAFRGPPPYPGARARHGDGGPRDDALANLRWG